MKPIDLTRPDKLIFQGIKSLTNSIDFGFYADQKAEAKANAEVTFIGEKKMEKVQSQLFDYNSKEVSVSEEVVGYEFLKEQVKGRTYWLNFHGIHDVEIIQKIGNGIDLDRLTIRQILDTTQRPKVEEYDQYLFFSVKSILKVEQGRLKMEHLSFILGSDYLVSFQEEKSDHFEGIRNKLVEGLGFARKKKSDYLLSQLLDAILDNYFETIDQINHEVSLIENEAIKNPDKSTLILLETHKLSAQVIKKALRPFKEALTNIFSGHANLINNDNMKYYKDLSNSSMAAMEEIDATLKTLDGLTNIYFASQSQKMNETMKVLTTVATIFIPLTFIAGIYGMNFEHMPELKNPNGYFYTLGSMGIIFVGMLILFKIKKWI
jgi:magnesium transporter